MQTSPSAPAALPSPPDTSAASAVFGRLRERLAQVPEASLAPPKADVKLAALAALAVADRLAPPEVRARFARLPREELDPKNLDDLRDAAWAAWHAKGELDSAVASAGESPLPPELAEQAQALREKMLRVARYWLEDDAAVIGMLATMGRRKGNSELPGDLSKLSKLYRERQATLQADLKFYSAADADLADRLASQAAELSGTRKTEAQQRGAEQVARAFALLSQIYDEVRAAGLYLFRREPNAAELFPALSSVSAGRGRPKKANGAPPSDPPPPSTKLEAESLEPKA